MILRTTGALAATIGFNTTTGLDATGLSGAFGAGLGVAGLGTGFEVGGETALTVVVTTTALRAG